MTIVIDFRTTFYDIHLMIKAFFYMLLFSVILKCSNS